jgi:hypothetical protein
MRARRDQLALDVPNVGLSDIDIDAADAAEARSLDAILAEASRPRPCRCIPRPWPWDDRELGLRCLRCGRRLP